MAVPTTTRKVSYAGTNIVSDYSFPYLFLAERDLVVKKDGVVLVLATDYTTVGATVQAGGTVRPLVAVASTSTLTIERTVDNTQPTSFRAQGSFAPGTHENALDRAIMVAQQLEARLAVVEGSQVVNAAAITALLLAKLTFGYTDGSGVPGNCTINTPSGKCAIATGVAFVDVTNSLVTTSSIVLVTQSNGANTRAVTVQSLAGKIRIAFGDGSLAAGNTYFNFLVIN